MCITGPVEWRGLGAAMLQTLFCVLFHRFALKRGSRWPEIYDGVILVNREPLSFTARLELWAND